MSYKESDNIADGLDEDNNDVGNTNNESTALSPAPGLEAEEINQHDTEVRKRIDALKEKKRLKDLLDDSDDW